MHLNQMHGPTGLGAAEARKAADEANARAGALAAEMEQLDENQKQLTDEYRRLKAENARQRLAKSGPTSRNKTRRKKQKNQFNPQAIDADGAIDGANEPENDAVELPIEPAAYGTKSRRKISNANKKKRISKLQHHRTKSGRDILRDEASGRYYGLDRRTGSSRWLKDYETNFF